MEKEAILKMIPFFSQLDRLDLAKLVPELEELHYDAGEILFHKGDRGNSLLIITRGRARVFIPGPRGEERDLAFIKAYECLGEMALLSGESRSASVQAETALTALRLTSSRFERLLETHQFLSLHLNKVLAQRLALTNEGAVSPPGFKRLPAGPEDAAADLAPAPDHRHSDRGSVKYGLMQLAAHLKNLATGKNLLVCAALVICSVFLARLLQMTGFNRDQVVIAVLLLLAAAGWSTNILSFNVIALALPVAAVLLGVSEAQVAFTGFSSSSWFLMLSVLAIAVAMDNTGLLYRVGLWTITKFSPHYANQTLALAVSGLILTPVIPSSDGRTALAGSLALDLIHTFGLKDHSAGAVGVSMACMLGFGQMSFMFMNGSAACLLVFGLLSQDAAAAITWGYWLRAALPLAFFYFLLSWFTILFLYREKIEYKPGVIASQLRILGPPTLHEIISFLVVGFYLIGQLTQPIHHINSAWIAIIAFLLLFGTSVLNDSSVRKDIDWNRLISYGALVGFGAVIQQSGFTLILTGKAGALFSAWSEHSAVFLLGIAVAVHLLRFALPLVPALVVSTLTLTPLGPMLHVEPFVIALIILASSNPWFLPYQSTIYQNLVAGTEDKAFHHRQTLKFAYSQIAIILFSIMLCIPYWRMMGMMS